jgi:hypothetical protein
VQTGSDLADAHASLREEIYLTVHCALRLFLAQLSSNRSLRRGIADEVRPVSTPGARGAGNPFSPFISKKVLTYVPDKSAPNRPMEVLGLDQFKLKSNPEVYTRPRFNNSLFMSDINPLAER